MALLVVLPGGLAALEDEGVVLRALVDDLHGARAVDGDVLGELEVALVDKGGVEGGAEVEEHGAPPRVVSVPRAVCPRRVRCCDRSIAARGGRGGRPHNSPGVNCVTTPKVSQAINREL